MNDINLMLKMEEEVKTLVILPPNNKVKIM